MTGKFNITILVAPLDWGLGHAARCVPIIRHLISIGCKVIVASEGAQQQLLKMEFPGIEFLVLEGYRINYTRSKRFFAVKILWQIPKILRAIKTENRWLRTIVKKHNIDAIISDNRYGLWHSDVPSIFITHQLQVQAPWIVEKQVQKINYRFINRFAACWVPDSKAAINLAGRLSHPAVLPKVPVKYINGLSRFESKTDSQKQYDLLIVISGPEPQRTILENKLLQDLQDYTGKVFFVRGLPGQTATLESFNEVTMVNHLPAEDMNVVFEQSEFIISRSGYTTVMDIIKLGKKSILIPTPGQTEQAYLADHLHKQKWCLSFSQDAFELKKALEEAATFPYQLPGINMEEYKVVVDEFVTSLRK